nr:B-cell receptor CD22-like [Pelodiscus sinensis]|eukprot:XP_025035740.1 B-cell receptor CD22-like [Pelodiscus sinensis]
METLLLALSILTGACCQNWGVTLPQHVTGWRDSCVTIPCSYTYPKGQLVRSVTWCRGKEKIVQLPGATGQDYSKAKRAQLLGDLQHNCSLRLGPLELGDGGTYHVEFQTETNKMWRSPRALCLTVSEHPCSIGIGFGRTSGALTGRLLCHVSEQCACSNLAWYDRAGAQLREQKAGSRSAYVGMNIIWQHRGTALECQVQGFQKRCLPQGCQSPATGRPRQLKVLVDTEGPGPIREGDSFTLRCVGDMEPSHRSYYWVHNDVDLPSAYSVRVEAATLSDRGNYTCIEWVSGPGWGYLAVSHTIYVGILVPPVVHVVATPGPHCSAGEPLSLICRLNTSAYGGVGFSWYKDGKRLEWAEPELAFPGVQVKDAGQYQCEVHNTLGKSTSLPLIITVVYGSDWYRLSPGPMAGFGAGVLLLLLLSNLGVYCLARRICPWQEPEETLPVDKNCIDYTICGSPTS